MVCGSVDCVSWSWWLLWGWSGRGGVGVEWDVPFCACVHLQWETCSLEIALQVYISWCFEVHPLEDAATAYICCERCAISFSPSPLLSPPSPDHETAIMHRLQEVVLGHSSVLLQVMEHSAELDW